MCFDISQLKPSTLHSKTISRGCLVTLRKKMDIGLGLQETWLLEVWLEHVHYFFVYSLDYARTRLANDAKAAGKGGGERQFNGLIDVYRKTIASDGVQGLYRGFVISCVGIVVYRGLYFGMFDSLKPVVLTGKLKDNFGATFLLGWSITIVAGLASYPIDTVRRRMMMTSGEKVKYNGSMDCFAKVVRDEGVSSLFKGAGANILRAVAGAGALSGYDQLQLIFFGKKFGDGSG